VRTLTLALMAVVALFRHRPSPGPPAVNVGVFRGTPIDYPRPALRVYPPFERLPRR
jgi:hypothetical protein